MPEKELLMELDPIILKVVLIMGAVATVLFAILYCLLNLLGKRLDALTRKRG